MWRTVVAQPYVFPLSVSVADAEAVVLDLPLDQAARDRVQPW